MLRPYLVSRPTGRERLKQPFPGCVIQPGNHLAKKQVDSV